MPLGVVKLNPSVRRRLDKRALVLAMGLAMVGVALAARLFVIQGPGRPRYLRLASCIRHVRQPEPPRPGTIYARDGTELAVSVLARSVCVNPEAFEPVPAKEREAAARKLAEALQLLPGTVQAKLSRPGHAFAYLKRCAPPGEVDRVLKMGIKGVYTVPEYRRVYPKGRLAANVLGARGADSQGLEGIELEWASLLEGRPGSERADVDPGGRPIIGLAAYPPLPPEPGKSLLLTVSVRLQEAAEAALDRIMTVNRPVRAICIVYDPQTGEILAMACRPTFDPNDISRVRQEQFRCIAVSQPFEPGSTWKPITVASALDAGAITLGSTFGCRGTEMLGDRPLRCWDRWATNGGHGTVTARDVLAQSCNIGAAKIATRLGKRRFVEYLRALHLDERLAAGLAGEQPGAFPSAWRMYERDLGNMGFGQGLRVTALHLVASYGALCNRGVLLQPNIIKEVRNPDGSVLCRREPHALGQVFSMETCRQTLNMLEYVVQHGTGKPAAIEGIRVGGKTGTAQIWDPVKRQYPSDEHLLAFCAVAPVDDPQFVVLVTVERPEEGRHGSDVAAPAAREVLLAALREKGLVSPDGTGAAAVGRGFHAAPGVAGGWNPRPTADRGGAGERTG